MLKLPSFSDSFNCFDVAEYFIAYSDNEEVDFISNLKLQKLVYYAQGFNLALYDKPLFLERIEAWQHGPVIPNLYHYYKENGSDPIRYTGIFNPDKYSAEQLGLLNEIYNVYGQFSAWKLRNLTHLEKPWIDAFDNKYDNEISQESLKEFFKTQLQ